MATPVHFSATESLPGAGGGTGEGSALQCHHCCSVPRLLWELCRSHRVTQVCTDSCETTPEQCLAFALCRAGSPW